MRAIARRHSRSSRTVRILYLLFLAIAHALDWSCPSTVSLLLPRLCLRVGIGVCGSTGSIFTNTIPQFGTRHCTGSTLKTITYLRSRVGRSLLLHNGLPSQIPFPPRSQMALVFVAVLILLLNPHSRLRSRRLIKANQLNSLQNFTYI